MKAIDVANELQKFVDGLRNNPDMEVSQPSMYFSAYGTSKEQFKNLARILPRPLVKSIDYEGTSYPEIVLKYVSKGLDIRLAASQSHTCRLVSPAIPAKYECDPILSPEEDAELERDAAMKLVGEQETRYEHIDR